MALAASARRARWPPPAEARSRFFNSGNAFNIVLPPVPARAIDDVAAQALTAAHSHHNEGEGRALFLIV